MNSQDFYNWCKLQSLLKTRALEVLRSLFKKLWHDRFNKEWSSSSGQDLINIIKSQLFKSYFKSQQSLLQTGNIGNWDLQLLRDVFVDSDICGTGKQGDNYRKVAGKLAEIRNKLEHRASKDVSDADFEVNWEKISKILVEMGESKHELEELKGSLKLQKMIIAQSQNIQKANEMKLEGNKYFNEKKFPEAISCYTDALALPNVLDQDLAVLYSNRSACYFERYLKDKSKPDDIENALKDAKKSKELSPEWYKAYFRLGKAYVELNKLDKATKAFERASILEPNNEELKTFLAYTRITQAEQNQCDHLDPGFHAMTLEQKSQYHYATTGEHLMPEDIEDSRRSAEEQNPTLKDVWKGHDYRDGTNGMIQDFKLAVHYYQKAVEKGNAEAMYNLARLTQAGLGVKKDFALAFSLFERAANQPAFDPLLKQPIVGVAEAEHAIGNYYWNGIFVGKDGLQALYWFSRAVEHGSGRSANNLGVMYMKGDDIKQDLQKAEQLFLLAASRNDPNAPNNLATFYQAQRIPEKALKWNKIAMERGSIFAKTRQGELEVMVIDVQKELETTGIVEWEKENNLSSDGLTGKERIERHLTFNNSEMSAFMENFEKTLNSISTERNGFNIDFGPKYDIKELEKYSHTSETAKRMYEAMKHFVWSFKFLMKIRGNMQNTSINVEECRQFITHLAESYRIEHIVAFFPIELIPDIKNLLSKIISQIHTLRQGKSLSENLRTLDQNARLCFAVLSLGAPATMIEFLSDSINKYPQNKEFFMFRGHCYLFEQKYEDGLRDFNRSLKMEPDNFHFLYGKAVSLRLLGHSNAVKAYEEYLAKAPIDDRKRPEAYYAMGTCTFYSSQPSKGSKNRRYNKKITWKKAWKYYDLGLEMEKKQLPFFLPCEAFSKKIFQLFVNPQSLLKKKGTVSKIEKSKLKDPFRKQLILGHRQFFKKWEWIQAHLRTPVFTFKSPKEQKLPSSLIGLKEVYINEIDWTKDHVLNKSVLEVSVIDVPLRMGQSIMLILEDKNGSVQMADLYNFDESSTDIKELGVGSKFSIINPYIRMALGEKPVIRVDDPSSVIFDEKAKKMCAYCGDLSADLVCGECKATSYCSPECKMADWLELKHQLICGKRKLWHDRYNKTWSSSSGPDLINITKPKSFKSYFKSQQTLLQAGDIVHWDLQLLRNVFVDSDICGAGKQGNNYRKNVDKLVEFRNKLEHHPSKNISDADFDANWEKIANILVKMGESKDELDDLKVSLRSNKMMILRSQNITKANEMKLEGNKYFKQMKYTEAILSYTGAITLPNIPDQDLAVLYSNRSASYLNRSSENRNNSDDLKNALKDAKKSRELNPDWFKPHLRLGRVYRQQNKLDKAIKAFDKALYLEPSNVEVQNAQADARKVKGEQDRYHHLDPGLYGVTQEQLFQEFYMRTGKNGNLKDLVELIKSAENLNPALKDVWEGHDYRDGTGGKKEDLVKAIECYRRAMEKGNAEAMFNLAGLTERGEGIKQDYALAFSLYQRAAEQPPFDPLIKGPTVGVAEAQHGLGLYYSEGIHVDKNEKAAMYWFERAVESGFGRSANNLGLMYLHGRGVNQDLKRAEQYLLFALSHNDHNAAGNLVYLYLALEDPEKALHWDKITREKGLGRATSLKKKLESLRSQLLEELNQNGVEEWEQANNLSSENLTPRERIHRKLRAQSEKASNFIENFRRICTEIMMPPKAQTSPSKIYNYSMEELEKYSQQSKTASIMSKATFHFLKSYKLLTEISEDVSFENEQCHEFICHLAECFRLEHIVAVFPPDLTESAKKIAKMIFSEAHDLIQIQEHDEVLLERDQNARLCFAVMNLGTPDTVIEFLTESIRLYPKNKDFLLFRGSSYGFKNQYEDALRDANRGLEIKPENYEFLYLKAVSLRVLGHSDAIKAYQEFISKAPIDHRKVPEAYYAMGSCTLSSKETLKHLESDSFMETILKKAKEYYESGLEMEKKQLPFFSSDQSPSKKVLEPWMDPMKLLEEVKPPSSIHKLKLKDPSRKELILLNRKHIKSWTNIPKGKVGMPITFKPPKEQKLPRSLIGLKKIYLNEIDFTKDHVLNGYVLEVTAIDVPLRTGSSIQLIVEDKNEHVQRVALYNFDETQIDVKELGVGSKLSIINPYIRMSMDLKLTIRVDDPSTVIFGEKVKNMCACCGDVSQDLLVCGACERTAYCSEECQKVDWKEFKHKLTCVKK